METYEQKIDSMRHELHQVRSVLDALVDRGSSIMSPSGSQSQQGFAHREITSTPRSNPVTALLSNSAAREDNMQMVHLLY